MNSTSVFIIISTIILLGTILITTRVFAQEEEEEIQQHQQNNKNNNNNNNQNEEYGRASSDILEATRNTDDEKKKRSSSSKSQSKSRSLKNNNERDPSTLFENLEWFNFDCQVCSALCTELDHCVQSTASDHPIDELLQCAIDNVTEHYGYFHQSSKTGRKQHPFLRKRTSDAEGRKEKVRQNLAAAAAAAASSDSSSSSSKSSPSPASPSVNNAVKDKIKTSLHSNILDDVYHEQVFIKALIASGKGRRTRQKVPHDICFELLCHEQLHLCHEDEHPAPKSHDIEERINERLLSSSPSSVSASKSRSQSRSQSETQSDTNVDDDDEEEEQVVGTSRPEISKDRKFSTHNDHHNEFKHSFDHFVDHFESKHISGGRSHHHKFRANSHRDHHLTGRLSRRRRSAFHHHHATHDELNEIDQEISMRSTYVGDKPPPSSSPDL